MERQKQTIIYPVLQKVFRAVPEEFRLLEAAYTPEELRAHEDRLANSSWDASYLPELVKTARRRLAAKMPQ